MARVGIDLDGVLYDFSGSVFRYLKHIDHDIVERIPTAPESERWEFYEDWGMTLHEFLEHVSNGVDAGIIFTGPARPGSAEALHWLQMEGHTVVIVTDRRSGTPGKAEENTREWLAENNIPFDELHFDSDKTAYNCDWFIEDKIANYDALVAADVSVALVDRPWNQADDKVRNRVDGVREFARIVIDLEDYTPELPDEPVPFLPAGEVRTVSATGGEKGVKLARFDLIPSQPLWDLAELYGVGAMKYEDRNWEKGYEWSKSYQALLRHLLLWWMGEEHDHELSTLSTQAGGAPVSHLSSVIWHAIALQYFDSNEEYGSYDDRPINCITQFEGHLKEEAS
jgi:hypothetical protein